MACRFLVPMSMRQGNGGRVVVGAVAHPQRVAAHINRGGLGQPVFHHRDMGDIAIDGEHTGAATAVLAIKSRSPEARMPSGPLIG